MPTNLSTRKPLRKLTRADLQAFPVWEWAINEEGIEGGGESTVRPTTHAAIPVDVPARYIVAAHAHLRDRTVMPALVEVTVDDRLRHVEPLGVLLLDRHLDFVGREATRLLSHYTHAVNNYPVRWQLAVPLANEKTLRSERVKRSLLCRVRGVLQRLRPNKQAHFA